jgi:PIN domain nuclease of toxin-antitoxin system
MKLLLDTHAFIWWDRDPAQLPAPALAALKNPANEVWPSVASVWEMDIKARFGKLVVLRGCAADSHRSPNSVAFRTAFPDGRA